LKGLEPRNGGEDCGEKGEGGEVIWKCVEEVGDGQNHAYGRKFACRNVRNGKLRRVLKESEESEDGENHI
jgi:GTPase involved in cell partitioning and DNA repair